MAATDSLTSVPFPADITAPSCWDSHVPSVGPYSSTITLPDTDNIIAELSMIESAISTPVPSDHHAHTVAPSPLPSHPPTPPPKRPAPPHHHYQHQHQQPPAKKLKTSPCLGPAPAPSAPTGPKPDLSLFVSSPLTSPVSPAGSLCSDHAVDHCSPAPSHPHHTYQQQQHLQQQHSHQPIACVSPPLSPIPSSLSPVSSPDSSPASSHIELPQAQQPQEQPQQQPQQPQLRTAPTASNNGDNMTQTTNTPRMNNNNHSSRNFVPRPRPATTVIT